MEYGSEHLPTEIRQVNEERVVQIAWDSGENSALSMEFLRVFCPCAECRGHQPSQAKLIDGKQDVTVDSIIPIGNYAVKLVFSDGHDTGVYSWESLYELGAKRDLYWKKYLQELDEAGKNREICTLAVPKPSGCSTGSCGS